MSTGRVIAAGILALLAASGCGGGGGGGQTPAPAPTVSIFASPAEVAQGETTRLQWSSQNATACEASGAWSGARSLSGSAVVGPLQAASTFRLTCTGAGGASATSSVTVNVRPPPPPVDFSATPSSIPSGGTTLLEWSAQDATSCVATGGWSGTRPPSGSETVGPLDQTTAFALSCTGPAGTSTAEVTVFVDAQAPTLDFTAAPEFLRAGEQASLTWFTTDADGCLASGGAGAWPGPKPAQGAEFTPPLTTRTSFTLTCTGPGGSVTGSVTVLINSVSGAMLLSAIARTDSDVNDPGAPYADNGALALAQPLPNPAVVGGYVNAPGRGPDGRSFAQGDLDDIYAVSLAAGQVVELVMPSADPSLPDDERDDADLGLYDANGALVDESLGTGQVERLTAPATGDYFVRVQLYSGAPLYRLSVGQAASATVPAGTSLRLGAEFVPGQVVVMGGHGVRASAGPGVLSALEGEHGLRRLSGAPGREMLMSLPPMAVDGVARLGSSSAPSRAEGLSVPPQLEARRRTLQSIKRLAADPAMPPVYPNLVVRATAAPTDPLYATQRWHYELIQLPAARDLVVGDPSVVVAVVDSGVVDHPDLSANLFDGYDFIQDPANTDGDGLDPDPDDPGCILGGSSVFHGTHVAGTVSAVTDNGVGGAGVAGNAAVMPLRVLDGCEGTGTFYDVLQAVRYAAGLANDSGRLPSRPADVVNLSLGGQGVCDLGLQDFFAEIRDAGAVVVASAGNDGTSATSVPGACPDVIAVSAVDPNRARAYYSNFGDWVDVAAPGGDMRLDVNGDGSPDGILSTDATGGGDNRSPVYSIQQGTSMASPHVAGVLALMKAANPALSPADVTSLLRQGLLTDDIGPPGPDELGVGLINAFRAVQAAGGDLPDLPATLTISPSQLNFGSTASQAEVVAANGGTGALEVSDVTPSDDWIAVAALDADASGLGRYTVSVTRAGLAPGLYEGWVDFASTAGTARLSVVMQAGVTAGVPDTGVQYVLLVDGAGEFTAEQVAVRATGESVPYRFGSVDYGRYFVIAGTDLNNDGFICDPGEACGAYPVENDPVEIEVAGEMTGLDFASTYRVSVQPAGTAADDGAGRGRKAFRRLR